MKPRLMQAIALELQPSKLLLGLLSSVSIASCVILAQLPLSIFIKLVLIGLVVISTVYFVLRDVLLRLPNSWKRIEVSSQGGLKLTNHRGESFEATLADSTLMHGFVTILNFKNWRLPPVIIFTNPANQEELRKLRVWLRWWKHQEALSLD